MIVAAVALVLLLAVAFVLYAKRPTPPPIDLPEPSYVVLDGDAVVYRGDSLTDAKAAWAQAKAGHFHAHGKVRGIR